MTIHRLFASGQELQLGKKIGKGGEGEVFAVANLPGFAVKAYFPHLRPERQKKIRAMVEARLGDHASFIAFPFKEVVDEQGCFVGFVMRLVAEHREIHEIQTPTSRLKYFPKADYRFIVRVALNVARAFAQVHSTGCIVGDINQRSILVSKQATVALIDADSFQLTYNGISFYCVVGVPEYTPPELQGQSLAKVARTIDHDGFGLAVAIFQLLCMDRHPFSGRYEGRGDMPLEKAISEFRFAYSEKPTGMKAPPGSVRLTDFTPIIAQLFERAFSKGGVGQRPTSGEWVNALSEFEASLRQCSYNKLHHYARTSSDCPWCRMEKEFGRPVFIDINIGDVHLPNGKIDPARGFVIDVSAITAAVTSVQLPSTISVNLPTVRMPPPSNAAIEKMEQAKKAPLFKWAGAACIVASILLFFLQAIPGIASILLFGFGLFVRSQGSSDHNSDVLKFDEISRKIKQRAEALQRAAPIEKALLKRTEIFSSIEEYNDLVKRFCGIQSEYDSKRRQKQLDAFLSNNSIRAASIAKLTSSDVAALASFGITTAYDASRRDVLQVYGIGPVKAAAIATWIKNVENKFRFHNPYTQQDLHNIKQLQNDIILKQQGIDERLKRLVNEYRAAMRSFEAWRTSSDPELSRMVVELSQLASDLNYLGNSVSIDVTIPSLPISQFNSQPSRTGTQSGHGAPAPRQGSPSCPICNGGMIRRTAKRGMRRGRQFWGCARYPVCKGTRN